MSYKKISQMNGNNIGVINSSEYIHFDTTNGVEPLLCFDFHLLNALLTRFFSCNKFPGGACLPFSNVHPSDVHSVGPV
jgi:hypothetical protein